MYQRKKNRGMFRGRLLFQAVLLFLPLILVFALVAQTASAKTYVITDGQRVFTYTTSETNPETVLGLAGLELTDRDTYTTEAAAAGTAITVRRAQTVTVDYRGEITTVHTWGETVGSLLTTLNIFPESGDTLSHAMTGETYDGMYLSIRQVVTRKETYTAAVAHKTTRSSTPSLPAGAEVIVSEGRNGELLCTAEVTYVNGREVSRIMLEQTVLHSAVEEVIAVGTGAGAVMEAAATGPDSMPVICDGYLLLPTGEMLTYTHTAQVRATAYTHTDAGCDLVTATGSTVHIGTVAVDPRYIPYGTRMFIVANDGSYVYGISEAEDCGGAIKGDRVDLYFPTYDACMEFGWRSCTIYFLG